MAINYLDFLLNRHLDEIVAILSIDGMHVSNMLPHVCPRRFLSFRRNSHSTR